MLRVASRSARVPETIAGLWHRTPFTGIDRPQYPAQGLPDPIDIRFRLIQFLLDFNEQTLRGFQRLITITFGRARKILANRLGQSHRW